MTRKVKKVIEEETDLTILKDTKEFLENLAENRFIHKEDVVHRLSLDVGDNSFNLIANTFSKHQDPEVTFTRTEQPGNLCSGVKRSIVLAYAEGIQENDHNLRVICELLQLHKLSFVVAADLKLLNILHGISGHSGKFSCIYCEGEMRLEPGKLRIFGSIIQHCQDYVDAGSPVSRMQNFKNCINMPLLDFNKDSLVEEEVPPPELHLMMGGCNVKLEVIREVCAREGVEEQLWTWCSRNGVTRRGYDGKNKLDGKIPTYSSVEPAASPCRTGGQ